jgi:hypothetical protein
MLTCTAAGETQQRVHGVPAATLEVHGAASAVLFSAWGASTLTFFLPLLLLLLLLQAPHSRLRTTPGSAAPLISAAPCTHWTAAGT